MTEFELIRRYFARQTHDDWLELGIGDDAALINPPVGRQLVLCSDTLIAGRHFPVGTAATDIGWKALAVNLSDLAAMGAVPLGFLLNLSLPESDETFVAELASGLFELADAHALRLVGGDTTRGPLSLTITAFGHVQPGQALRRDAARPGDVVVVAGDLGAAALALAQGSNAPADVRVRLDRPHPQLQAGQTLAGVARCAIDISDGLAADLEHILIASGCGAELDLAALPLGPGLDRCPVERATELALYGGDDYALCATVPQQQWPALAIDNPEFVAVGTIRSATGLVARDASGKLSPISTCGYRHF